MKYQVMTKVLFSSILLASTAAWAEQPYEVGWVSQFGASNTDYAESVVGDDSGNVYTVGATQDSNFGFDAFLAKHDSSGNQVWFRQFGTAGGDYADAVAVDSHGNVYMTGTTTGALEEGQPYLGGFFDAYVARFDAEGALLWIRQFGSGASDFGNSVATDSAGNVYISGTTTGTLTGGQGNHGLQDAFITKFSSDGTALWTEQFGTDEKDSAASIAINSSGNIYVAGSTIGILEGQTNSGLWDGFLAKYDSDGVRRWIKQYGTPENDFAVSVAVGADCSVYVTGSTHGVFQGQTGAGVDDSYLIKFDGDSTPLWVRQFGGDSADYGASVASDSSGNVYVAGFIIGEIGDPLPERDDEAYLAKFYPDGNLAWLNSFGTDLSDTASSVSANGTGSVYVAGQTLGTFEGETSNGYFDAFLVNFAVPLTSASDIINETIALIGALPDESFKEPNLRHTLQNKLYAVLSLIAEGNSLEALNKLSSDVLIRTDGCFLRGIADKQDWIGSCDNEVGQPPVYSSIMAAIAMLEKNLGGGTQ